MLRLNPIRERKVEAEDNAAATNPAKSNAPSRGDRMLRAAQTRTSSLGSMAGLLRFTVAAAAYTMA